MKKIAFVTTTSTNAGKGRELLHSAGIMSEIRKIQGGTASGCLFGITVATESAAKAENILQNAGIRIISVREVLS